MKSLRLIIAAGVAVGVTFGLFLFMYKLISMGSDQRTELDAIAGIHFGPVEIPDEVIENSRRKPPKPEGPEAPAETAATEEQGVSAHIEELVDLVGHELRDNPVATGVAIFVAGLLVGRLMR